MSIINNILRLMDELKINQNELCAYLHIGTSTMSNWKNRGTDPPSKYIIPICEFLHVTPEYLLTGEERSIPGISQSAITVGNHSTSTVNINSQETTPSNYIEALPEKIDTFPKSENDEMVQEIARILNKLPLRERTKLLSIVYNFEEQYQKTQNENKIG